ncbi:MAG: ABC transporter permease [Candidatus Nanopelagicaceae bacterium]|jgi:peptide/nickel transport system permease protein
MGKFLIRRATSSLIVLAMSVVMVFMSIRILPGDPVLAKLGAATEVTPAALKALREEAGLNRPLLVQLFSWISRALHGDLGVSYFSQFPVTRLVAERIPVTLELTFFIIVIAVVLSLILAPLSTLKPGSIVDRVIGYFTSTGLSVPGFVIGIIFILIFSLQLQWLPSRGYVPMSEGVAENLKLMILPSITGGLTATPYLVRYLRASMLEIKQSPFVRTAEGKGLSSARILFRHILPNSLVPTLTMLGLIVGYTLSGVVVIEYMFGLPGIGSLAIESSFKRDYVVIQGVALTIISFFILTTFLFDVLCGIVDPRLRLSKEQKSEV